MVPSKLNLAPQERNWSDLPSDVMLNILDRVSMVDIHKNVQKVCTSWYTICKDPSLWRVINMNDLWCSTSYSIANIFKHAVDRSQGQLVDVTLYHNDGELFRYVADRSPQLRRLEMASVFKFGSLSTNALTKLPLLKELNLYVIPISKEEIETVGRYCPMLKTLKVNAEVPRRRSGIITDEEVLTFRYNEIAIAVGQNLPELRHLELIGNNMTDIGLQVILDNCHHLETLDLRGCRNIDFKGDLEKNCSQQIKHLKLPNDSLYGCPYYYELDGDNLFDYDERYEDGLDYDSADLYDETID